MNTIKGKKMGICKFFCLKMKNILPVEIAIFTPFRTPDFIIKIRRLAFAALLIPKIPAQQYKY